MNAITYVTPEQLLQALTLRDLSEPTQGSHVLQRLLGDVLDALQSTWACTVNTVRTPPVVS